MGSFHIHKFLKSDLSEVSDVELVEMDACKGMSVSHFSCSNISTQMTIPFVVIGEERHVPYVKEIETMIAFKEVVDATAVGVDGTLMKNTGKDVGRGNYKDTNPTRPSALPPGFREVKK